MIAGQQAAASDEPPSGLAAERQRRWAALLFLPPASEFRVLREDLSHGAGVVVLDPWGAPCVAHARVLCRRHGGLSGVSTRCAVRSVARFAVDPRTPTETIACRSNVHRRRELDARQHRCCADRLLARGPCHWVAGVVWLSAGVGGEPGATRSRSRWPVLRVRQAGVTARHGAPTTWGLGGGSSMSARPKSCQKGNTSSFAAACRRGWGGVRVQMYRPGRSGTATCSFYVALSFYVVYDSFWHVFFPTIGLR